MAHKSVSTALGLFSVNRSIVALLAAAFAAAMILILGATYSAKIVHAHDPAHDETHFEICDALIDDTDTFLMSNCEVLLDIKDALQARLQGSTGATARRTTPVTSSS